MRRAPLFVLAGVALAGSPGHWISQNEAQTIEHLLFLVRAEATYQSSNSGLYDHLRCLAAPASCIPRYDGPVILDPALASLPSRHGYRFRFHRGPEAGSRYAMPGTTSPSSMVRYAITATPLLQGVTGRRWFCVDESGLIREPDGPALAAREGGCVRANRTAKAAPPSSPEEGEARTIADLRLLVSVQQAYAAANCGYFDRLDCLAEPWRCLPTLQKDGPIFLDPQVASLTERHGYRRRFYPGPSAPRIRGDGCSPTSMLTYAFTAVPALPGRSGRRGFCADSTGAVCDSPGGEPGVVGAHCEPCVPVP